LEINSERLIAYIDGRMSEDERIKLKESIETSPELEKEVENLRFILLATEELKRQKAINVEKNWKRLSWRMGVYKVRIKTGRFIWRAAAVLFIPLLISTYFLFDRMKNWQDLSVERVELTTAYGLVSRITLPDGSEVWLNSGSSISYPKEFTEWTRKVNLSGEAYFKVSADRLNRFEVIVRDGITVSAYGTEFNISAYEDDSLIEATLVKGNVDISNKDEENNSYTLLPGEHAVYNKERDDIKVEKTNVLIKTGWKDGKMIFRRANMAEVAKRLSRRFNADIDLEGKELYGYEYSATFTTETLDEIIFLLEKSAPIKCRIIEPELTDDLSFSRRKVIIRRK